jgi:trimeric autotransporter adhesin
LTPANVQIGDIFIATINGKSVQYVAQAATAADVNQGLADAWNAATIPEFEEITAFDQTTQILLMADTPGVPFTVTTSTIDGGGNNTQTLTDATIQSATGPNWWNQALNWSTGSVPVTGDNVAIDSGNASILYGLAQSSVTLASLTVTTGYTGAIGLPAWNANDYAEYRQQYLAIGVTAEAIGTGASTSTFGAATSGGPSLIKIDNGSAQTTLNVQSLAQSADRVSPTMFWKGIHSSNVVQILKGSMGIAYSEGETANIATLYTGFVSSQQSDVSLVVGAGCTLATVIAAGGSVQINSNTTSLTCLGSSSSQGGGQATVTVMAGSHTDIEADGGVVKYNSIGTLTTPNIGAGGVLDFSGDLRPKNVTNPIQINATGTLLDPFKVVSGLAVDFNRCSPSDCTVNWGDDLTLTRS